MPFKPVRFYCKECGQEIFQGMGEAQKVVTTIAEVEKTCVCSECILKEFKKEE